MYYSPYDEPYFRKMDAWRRGTTGNGLLDTLRKMAAAQWGPAPQPNTLTMAAASPTMGAGAPFAQYDLPEPDSEDGQLSRLLQFSPSGAQLPPTGTQMMDAQGRPIDRQRLLELMNRINSGRRLIHPRLY